MTDPSALDSIRQRFHPGAEPPRRRKRTSDAAAIKLRASNASLTYSECGTPITPGERHQVAEGFRCAQFGCSNGAAFNSLGLAGIGESCPAAPARCHSRPARCQTPGFSTSAANSPPSLDCTKRAPAKAQPKYASPRLLGASGYAGDATARQRPLNAVPKG